MPRLSAAFAVFLLVASTVSALADEFTYAPLDDFEDASPWVKGDPNTDLTQKEVAIAPSTQRMKQGKQSLAFMIRVDWTPKPGEKYPKGWPMLSREFAQPQDWSKYDAVRFWLYTETQAELPKDRVLRCGFQHGDQVLADDEWYTLPGIRPGEWQQMTVPLDPRRKWDDVTRILFYVAEGWYQDGDRISFYIDDMRLATRKWPVLEGLEAGTRTLPRGSGIAVTAAIAGPPEGSKLRWSVTDMRGKVESTGKQAVAGRTVEFTIPPAGILAGNHCVRLALVDATGEERSIRRQFVTVLEPGKRAYLSLITFYTSVWREKPEQLAVVNDSAYAGVAVPVWSGYDTDPVPPYAETIPKLRELRKLVNIDVWPWVFSNRLFGVPEDATRHPSVVGGAVPDYFARIRVLDLDDEAGARSDVLTQWRYAVRAARELGAPGIVLDLEAYNNYKAYDVAYVAEKRGESVSGIVAKCESIGADLARICEEEYPTCIVWSLFSRLEASQRRETPDGPLYSTAGHISLGFLKHARDHHVPCKYLCGGEVTPGYYNRNVDALKRRIAQRDAEMADMLAAFPNHLFLAGTISPYHDASILTSWIKDAAGENPELKTIQDFGPMFRTLFDAYDWVWIYASSAAKTEPYDPERNRQYSDVLRAALEEASR
ncbi:MAG: hypothetical protein FJX75_01305 [Armatimonadetes bacterium]|nr:hypothetical protein [Armatimonadota bacterium]